MDNVNVVSAVANVKVAEAATEMLPQRTGKSCKPSSRFKSLLKGGVAAAVLLSATVGGASFEGISVAQAQVGQTGAGGVHRVFEGLYFWDGNGWEPVYKTLASPVMAMSPQYQNLRPGCYYLEPNRAMYMFDGKNWTRCN